MKESTNVGTSLAGKEYEPMILRRYSCPPFLHWVGMICGDNLDRLDEVVANFWEQTKLPTDTIQECRNVAGALQDEIIKNFKKIEGVAVILSCDKMLVVSLYGDFMNHDQCKKELYDLLQLSTRI